MSWHSKCQLACTNGFLALCSLWHYVWPLGECVSIEFNFIFRNGRYPNFVKYWGQLFTVSRCLPFLGISKKTIYLCDAALELLWGLGYLGIFGRSERLCGVQCSMVWPCLKNVRVAKHRVPYYYYPPLDLKSLFTVFWQRCNVSVQTTILKAITKQPDNILICSQFCISGVCAHPSLSSSSQLASKLWATALSWSRLSTRPAAWRTRIWYVTCTKTWHLARTATCMWQTSRSATIRTKRSQTTMDDSRKKLVEWSWNFIGKAMWTKWKPQFCSRAAAVVFAGTTVWAMPSRWLRLPTLDGAAVALHGTRIDAGPLDSALRNRLPGIASYSATFVSAFSACVHMHIVPWSNRISKFQRIFAVP